MTKYVLAGGSDRLHENYGKNLARFLKGELNLETATMLSCFFSQDKENRAEQHNTWSKWFKTYFPASTTILHADEVDFYNQVDQSDIIYFHGGATQNLLDILPDFAKVKESLTNKIVIGSSAGSNYLSTRCYSPTAGAVLSGSGILPVGVMVHYMVDGFNEFKFTQEDWNKNLSLMKDETDGLPIILIPEGTFTIIEQ